MRNESILRIGFSPCPNDTYIFDAMVNKKIDTEGLSFEPVLEDVEKLNQRAISADLDITKLSIFAYGFLSKNYQILDSGAALGRGVGPLLISKKEFKHPEESIKSVALPGEYTTANFLFSLFYPSIKTKKFIHFSSIENAVLSGEVDAGVIIHENRFTYHEKGLMKISDLGTKWENITGMEIPLGGIAIKRELNSDLKLKVNSIVRKSIEYANANPISSNDYVKFHAQEMEADVIDKHINLYVNERSISLGLNGRKAIYTLYEKAKELNLINVMSEPIFLEINDM